MERVSIAETFPVAETIADTRSSMNTGAASYSNSD